MSDEKPRELIGLFNGDEPALKISIFGVGGIIEQVPMIEKSAYERACKERDEFKKISEQKFQTNDLAFTQEISRLRAVLEEIANTRCAWQLSQKIAREALKAAGGEE